MIACNQSDFGDPKFPEGPTETPSGPGDPAWGSDDVSCETKRDCSVNEDCIDNVCQMPRCADGPYDSAAPLGPVHYFFSDLEVVVADSNLYQGNYWVDTYLPSATELTYPSGGGSWKMGADKITDVAGGNLVGSQPERFVVSHQGRSSITVNGTDSTNSITVALSFVPVAVGAGDIDHDSIDEVVAIGPSAQFAICHVDENRCDGYNLGAGLTGHDVAVADVDGDGYAEPVLMVREANGKTEILAFNENFEDSGEEQLVGLSIDTQYKALDAGDVDGDGVAEIYALEDGGFAGFAKDHVHVWQIHNTTRIGNKTVDADSKDIALADVDMSKKDKLFVLRDTRTVEVYSSTVPGQLNSLFTTDLSASTNPQRLAAADTDGDTPSARRISQEPEIIASQPVPTMVLNFPPYSKTFSDGEAGLYVGSGQNTSEDFTDTVGLSASVTIGVSAEFPGLFSADVSTSLSSYISTSRRISQRKSIGMRFSINADPETHGDAYSVVVLSSACYHSYKYELSDPKGIIGGDGGEFILMVPVGGQSTVWSNQRYNALAKALGTLPQVTGAAQLGDPSSYPSYPVSIVDGSPVDASNMLFPSTPTFLVSDVGKAGWWLGSENSETNSVAVDTSLSVSSNIKVGGFKVGGSVGASIGSGYGITVGEYVQFGGGVPPIPDNPDTPEDEYEAYRFSFSPYVYRETYSDSEGNEAGYYVLNYTVGK